MRDLPGIPMSKILAHPRVVTGPIRFGGIFEAHQDQILNLVSRAFHGKNFHARKHAAISGEFRLEEARAGTFDRGDHVHEDDPVRVEGMVNAAGCFLRREVVGHQGFGSESIHVNGVVGLGTTVQKRPRIG